jgi:hypothetical protein
MCPAKWNALEARILHLEAQNRCFRRLLLCAGLLVTVIVAAGANTSRTVEVQRFVLTSADGQMRAELTTLGRTVSEISFEKSRWNEVD